MTCNLEQSGVLYNQLLQRHMILWWAVCMDGFDYHVLFLGDFLSCYTGFVIWMCKKLCSICTFFVLIIALYLQVTWCHAVFKSSDHSSDKLCAFWIWPEQMFNHVTKELQYLQVDDMLRERDNIHCSFTTERTLVNPVGVGSSSRYTIEQSIPESPENGSVDGRDKSGKKKWFNLNLNRSDKKAWWIFCQGTSCVFTLLYILESLLYSCRMSSLVPSSLGVL